jgi:hypothetical protein
MVKQFVGPTTIPFMSDKKILLYSFIIIFLTSSTNLSISYALNYIVYNMEHGKF